MQLEEAVNRFKYAWEEWENVERDTQWRTIKEVLSEHRPDLVDAWDRFVSARMTMNNLTGAENAINEMV